MNLFMIYCSFFRWARADPEEDFRQLDQLLLEQEEASYAGRELDWGLEGRGEAAELKSDFFHLIFNLI